MTKQMTNSEEMTDFNNVVKTTTSKLKDAKIAGNKPFALTEKQKAAAALGVVLLGGSAFVALDHQKDATDVHNIKPVEPLAKPESHSGELAPHENIHQEADNMSFGEAFAHARHEMGAGETFSWRGDTYNTFYKEEWQKLPLAQKQAFLAEAGFAPAHHHPTPPTIDTTTVTKHDDNIHHPETPNPTTDTTTVTKHNDNIHHPEIPSPAIDTAATHEVVKDTTQQAETHAIAEKSIQEANAIAIVQEHHVHFNHNQPPVPVEPVVVETEIDGCPAYAIDDDGDGKVDAIIYLDKDSEMSFGLFDISGDNALEMGAIMDPNTLEVIATAPVDVPYEIAIDDLDNFSDLQPIAVANNDDSNDIEDNSEENDDDDSDTSDTSDDYNNHDNVDDITNI
jgi:hypothetical protein